MLGRLLAWLRGDRGGDAGYESDEDPESDDGGTIWAAMPDWSYGSGGRLQGAGIARDTQERAVEDVAEQGAKLAEVDDR